MLYRSTCLIRLSENVYLNECSYDISYDVKNMDDLTKFEINIEFIKHAIKFMAFENSRFADIEWKTK